MSELQTQGVLNETLVVYTSTGSIPFPMAKTNMYESGMATPLLISSPQHPENWGKVTSRNGWVFSGPGVDECVRGGTLEDRETNTVNGGCV